MRLVELPVVRRRREVQSAPELLRVEADKALSLSTFTKSLIVFTLLLLYCMFLGGAIYNIVTVARLQKLSFLASVAFFAVTMAIALKFIIPMIIKDKKKPLLFTEKGIVGAGFFCVPYDRIGTYGWERCGGAISFGKGPAEKTTLALTANKGFFSDTAFKNRLGQSILGTYCYFFSANEIKKAEEILSSKGIRRT